MATIRKVADLAGVSTATVSHVINDTRAVSAPLTARVLNAMEQLDYQPDIIARSLRRRETLTLGLIVPSIEIPFFARVAAGVEAAANDVGYSVILCNTGWSLSREVHYLNNLLARRVDGLLCISLAMSAEHIAPVLRRRTPVVVFERTMPGVEVDAVEIDNVQGAFDATAHLLDLGHRRIGCITGLPNSSLNEERILGYRRALTERDIPFDPVLVRTGDYTAAAGMRESSELLPLPEPPTAIFAFNDLMATGVMRAVQERGLRVPADVAVIGFDGLPITEHCSPPLSTVEQPVAEMSAAAIAMLLDRIKGGASPARVQTFTAKLVTRASTVGGAREAADV
ncbi:MAG: transcriptional regulator, LacI family [Thermomicrobiales bacterium]|nr:transcriptional regulator, LacI family [Thermomicrobiales bacterium]